MANNDGVYIEHYDNSATEVTGNNVKTTIIDLALVMPNYLCCISIILKNRGNC